MPRKFGRSVFANLEHSEILLHEHSVYSSVKEKAMDFIERAIMGDSEAILFLSVVGFLWVMFLWDFYLNLRQRNIMNNNVHPPKEALAIMTRDNYIKARSYALDKNLFNIANSWYSMFEMTTVLMSNVIPWLWAYAAQTTMPLTKPTSGLPPEEDLSEDHELKASLVFLIYVTVFSFCDSIPWKLYNNFVIESNHEINKQSMTFFLLDQVKSFIISLGLTIPICYGLLYVIKWGGRDFYLYAWSFGFIAMTFLMWIYPEFIAPLFDKYVPLPYGELKQSIVDLCAALEFPLTEVYVVQSSKRSSHSNAYFYGFWNNKRIVLFDTLIRDYNYPNNKQDKNQILTGDENQNKRGCSNSEILAILTHELGHWKLNHISQNLLIGQINLFLMFFAFGNLFNYGVLFKTFGFKEIGTPSLIKMVIIFHYLFSPYNALLEFMMTIFTRQNEFQADAFAVKMGKGQALANALIKLHNDNLTYPLNDNMYSTFNNSHPPLLERVKAINQMIQQ